MNAVKKLSERNRRFAQDEYRSLPFPPRLGMCIITCLDSRVDPAHVLGLELGDAAVIRVGAGRVSLAVMQQLLFLAQVQAARGQSPGSLELVLMQHTECGIAELLGPEHREMLAAFLGCAPDELDSRALDDPYGGVRVDVELLAANPLLPDSLSVTGTVYDLKSGRLDVVERRSPLRPAAGLSEDPPAEPG